MGVVSRIVLLAEGREMRQPRASTNTTRETLRLNIMLSHSIHEKIKDYHLIIGANCEIVVIEAAFVCVDEDNKRSDGCLYFV